MRWSRMSNTDFNEKLEKAFLPYIKYGITKNDNKKYLSMGYKSLIVAVFPYYRKENAEFFSKYCSVPDYHTVVKDVFESMIKDIFSDYKIMVDISPFKEKVLACELGLGEIGENNLLLTKDYGSYVFIGEALVKEELTEVKHEKQKICTHCKKCVRMCPSDALYEGFCKEKCLSYLTQKKELSFDEEKMLKKSSSFFGCDVCQSVCPVNEKIEETPIPQFKSPILNLDEKNLFSIDEETFKTKYHNYAFTYKGLEILKRNARIINER